MKANIAIVAFCDDGEAREVPLSDSQRVVVLDLLRQMFEGEVPVAKGTLPLEMDSRVVGCLTNGK